MSKKNTNSFAVNLYTGRMEKSAPTRIMIEKKATVNDYLSLYHHEGLEMIGVSSVVKQDEHLVAATVHLPSYFEEFSTKIKTTYSGIFMAKISTVLKKAKTGSGKRIQKNSSFWSFGEVDCKGFGSHDCPHRVQLSPENKKLSHLTFNGQAFFPLLMRNFTVIYNVADVSSKDHNWDHANYEGPKGSDFVAVDHPIEYDANLGIFVTRGAKLVSV